MQSLPATTLAGLVALGMGAGFLSTLFGIGGGILMVPVMVYVLHVEFTTATAISLLAITLLSPAGVYQHARRDAVDWRLSAWMAAGGAAGVAVGIWLEPQTPVPYLKLLLAAVMVLAAWRLAWPPPEGHGHGEARPAAVVALGAGAGVVSRLLGVGGGLVTVPALTLMGTAVHTAVGSSLVPVFTNAALASAVHLSGGLDGLPAIPLAAGALVATPLGTRLAHRLQPTPLKRLFSAALVLAAAYVAATAFRAP